MGLVIDQPDLFDLPAARERRRRSLIGLLGDTPRSRVTDPETSHQAAQAVKDSGSLRQNQLIVLNAVHLWPGRTAVELGHLMAQAGMTVVRGPKNNRRTVAPTATQWRFECSRRLPELVPVHVRRGKPRRCEIAGTPQAVWHPVKEREQ